jgi:hypothetical protein
MNEVKVKEADFRDVLGDIIPRLIGGIHNSGMPGVAYVTVSVRTVKICSMPTVCTL